MRSTGKVRWGMLAVGLVIALVLAVLAVAGNTAPALRRIDARVPAISAALNLSEPVVVDTDRYCFDNTRGLLGATVKTCYMKRAVLYYAEFSLGAPVSTTAQPPAEVVPLVLRDRSGRPLNPTDAKDTDDDIQVVYASSRYAEPGHRESFGGHWGTFGDDYPITAPHGGNVRDWYSDVVKKVFSDERIDEDVPSAVDYLNDGKAPILVVLSERYCHGPEIYVLGSFCVLPG